MSEEPRKVITLSNVDNFIGKTVDSKRKMFHYYPLTFKKIGADYYFVDRNAVMMRMDKNDIIYYDSVVDTPQKKPKDKGAR